MKKIAKREATQSTQATTENINVNCRKFDYEFLTRAFGPLPQIKNQRQTPPPKWVTVARSAIATATKKMESAIKGLERLFIIAIIGTVIAHICPQLVEICPTVFQFFSGVLKLYEFIFKTGMIMLRNIINIIFLNWPEALNGLWEILQEATKLLGEFASWLASISF